MKHARRGDFGGVRTGPCRERSAPGQRGPVAALRADDAGPGAILFLAGQGCWLIRGPCVSCCGLRWIIRTGPMPFRPDLAGARRRAARFCL